VERSVIDILNVVECNFFLVVLLFLFVAGDDN
jgi:hypothetical protein